MKSEKWADVFYGWPLNCLNKNLVNIQLLRLGFGVVNLKTMIISKGGMCQIVFKNCPWVSFMDSPLA